jgi:glutaredoxin
MNKVTVYGADWCKDTAEVREYLERRGVAFDFVDVEADPEASEWVKRQNGGKERKPTLQIGNQVLCVPTLSKIDQALDATGIR